MCYTHVSKHDLITQYTFQCKENPLNLKGPFLYFPEGHCHVMLSGMLGTYIAQYHDDTYGIGMNLLLEDWQAFHLSLEPVMTNGRDI